MRYRELFELLVRNSEQDDRAYPLLTRTQGGGDGYLDLYVQKKWEMFKACVEVFE